MSLSHLSGACQLIAYLVSVVQSQCSMCKFFVSLCIAISVQAVTGFELYAVHSGFSGLITAGISVGSNHQPVRVSLNFGSDYSFLVAAPLCPPHVPRCFDFKSSRSFFSTQFNDVVPATNGEMSGIAVVDAMYIDSEQTFDPVPFTLVTRWQPTSAAYREVGGVIAAGRNSEVFKNQIVAIFDATPQVNGIGIKSVSSAEFKEDTDLVVYTIRASWTVEAFLCIKGPSSGGVLRSTVQFDPSETNLVIPWTMKSAFHDKLVATGVVVIPSDDGYLVGCSPSGELDEKLRIGLRLVTGAEISLITSQFAFAITPGDVVHDHEGVVTGYVCPLRVKFSNTATTVVIGRQLIRSVSAVYLNYRSGLLGISLLPRGSPKPEPFITTRPLIPIYGDPRVSADLASGNVTVAFPHQADGSLVLGSRAVRRFQLGGNSYSCWMFYRAEPTLITLSASEKRIELAGSFRGAYLRIERDLVAVRFSPEGSDGFTLKAMLVETGDSVRVCVTEMGTKPV